MQMAAGSHILAEAADEIERLRRDHASALATAERNWEMIRQKDEAMGVLFERLVAAGVDCSDLIS